MAEKRYTEYIINGIIDGISDTMTDSKQTRPDIAFLKQRLYELSAVEKELLTKTFGARIDGEKKETNRGKEDVR